MDGCVLEQAALVDGELAVRQRKPLEQRRPFPGPHPTAAEANVAAAVPDEARAMIAVGVPALDHVRRRSGSSASSPAPISQAVTDARASKPSVRRRARVVEPVHPSRGDGNTRARSSGLVKSPFLGLVIGLIACGQGLLAQGGAAAVGARTTTAVVSGHFQCDRDQRRVYLLLSAHRRLTCRY